MTKNLGIQALNDGIDFRGDAWHFVAPSGEDAIRFSDSPNLGVESRKIKPVECRRHGHQVNRAVRERRPIGGSDEVVDLGVGFCMGDLLGAGVGGDDGTEVWRQPEGCLPAPSGAVPGEVVCGDKRGEVGKEGIGVRGPGCLVEIGAVGEVIGESN